MAIVEYPFYCVDKLDTIRAFDFLVKHPFDNMVGISYEWVVNYIGSSFGAAFSYYFFARKMHVFPIIINKGFRI